MLLACRELPVVSEKTTCVSAFLGLADQLFCAVIICKCVCTIGLVLLQVFSVLYVVQYDCLQYKETSYQNTRLFLSWEARFHSSLDSDEAARCLISPSCYSKIFSVRHLSSLSCLVFIKYCI